MSVQLSVIVPAYNAEAFLPACLRHILDSSCRDLELLLIDDGSADGTGAICDRFAAEVLGPVSEDLRHLEQARAVMYCQTVLRELKQPDENYIREAVSYVRQHKNTLLHHRWGIKYYLSALVLCTGYLLWAGFFRRGMD